MYLSAYMSSLSSLYPGTTQETAGLHLTGPHQPTLPPGARLFWAAARMPALDRGDDQHKALHVEDGPREASERVVAEAQPQREGERRQLAKQLVSHHDGGGERLGGQNNLHHLADVFQRWRRARLARLSPSKQELADRSQSTPNVLLAARPHRTSARAVKLPWDAGVLSTRQGHQVEPL